MRDQFGNGVAGDTVKFSVVDGGGFLAAPMAVSNASGSVTVPAWTVGRSAVPQRLRASFGSVTADFTAGIASSYTMDVRFFGAPMTEAQKALFTNAAARIGGFITGGVLPATVANLDVDNGCGAKGVAPLTETVDGIVIFASIQNIDGPGKILAQSGPCYVRSGNRLTIVGVMEFDSSDLASLTTSGSLQDVIQHEMLHVVGLGSLWNAPLLANRNLATVTWTGAGGIAGCTFHGGSGVCGGGVPVENTGGAGTANAHWRETTFTNELMTGFLNRGNNPLSQLTIRSMADLGYNVNMADFDDYTVPLTPLSISASRASTIVGIVPNEEWEHVFTLAEVPTSAGPGIERVRMQRTPMAPVESNAASKSAP
ncbi:MAG: hypothetical protein H0W68_14110 [Gemmatimonadaceae bacterium]|nr:hypothetical protein [Gemmatimonadaceae bacterium]